MITNYLYHAVLRSILLGCLLVCTAIAARAQSAVFSGPDVLFSSPSPVVDGAIGALNDGNAGNYCDFGNDGSDSLVLFITLPRPTALGDVELLFYSTSWGADRTHFYGSNDGTSWVELFKVDQNLATIQGVIADATPYTRYRFIFHGFRTSAISIREIRAFGRDVQSPVLTAEPGLVGSEVKLSWNPTVRVEGAYLLESSTDNVTYHRLDSLPFNVTTYTDTGLVRSTRYWYRIRAQKGESLTDYSVPVAVTTVDDSLKTAPSLSAKAGVEGRVVSLSWSGLAIFTDGEWQLEKSTDGTNFTALATLPAAGNDYLDTTNVRSTPYWYRIRGINYVGPSPYSAVANVLTVNDVLTDTPQLTATPLAIGTRVRLSWSGLTIHTDGSFELERAGQAGAFQQIATLGRGESAYLDTTASQATSYRYRIRGTNYVGPSPYSDVAEVVTVNDTLRTAPQLTAQAISGTSVQLNWQLDFATDGGFEVEKSHDGSAYGLVGRFDKETLQYIEESLDPLTTYHYRIRAFNYTSYGPYSTAVSVITGSTTAMATDITDDGGTLVPSTENTDNPNEGSAKLIDNLPATKFLLFNSQVPGALAVVYKPVGAYVVDSYAITTANDAPARDPRAWFLEGSNDNLEWTELDRRTGQLGLPNSRGQRFVYRLENPGTAAFAYYRITFTENNNAFDGVRFQIGELELFGVSTASPGRPEQLEVTEVTDSQVSLQWRIEAQKNQASRFVIQRSTNGWAFQTLDTINASEAPFRYVDTVVVDSMTYHYRVQSIGDAITLASGWSSVVSTTTLAVSGRPLAPLDLKASTTANDESVVLLTWQDRSKGLGRFVIDRARADGPFETILSVGPGGKAAVDSTVWPETDYRYRVRAITGDSQSNNSLVAGVKTLGFNNAPEASLPIIPFRSCGEASTVAQLMRVQGIVGGPGNELTQTVRLYGVELDSLAKRGIESVSFDEVIAGGVVSIRFMASGQAHAGDTVMLTLLVRDNGGKDLGTDTAAIQVPLIFEPFNLIVRSDAKDGQVPLHQEVLLTAVSNYPDQSVTYTWQSAEGLLGNGRAISVRVRPTRPTTYRVTATNAYGCTSTAEVTITPIAPLLGDAPVVASNVITPNGDGINDTWVVSDLSAYPENRVVIMDRSGRQVFSTSGYRNDWNGSFGGRRLNEGVYYYIIWLQPNATPIKGTLNIIHDR